MIISVASGKGGTSRNASREVRSVWAGIQTLIEGSSQATRSSAGG